MMDDVPPAWTIPRVCADQPILQHGAVHREMQGTVRISDPPTFWLCIYFLSRISRLVLQHVGRLPGFNYCCKRRSQRELTSKKWQLKQATSLCRCTKKENKICYWLLRVTPPTIIRRNWRRMPRFLLWSWLPTMLLVLSRFIIPRRVQCKTIGR